MTCREKLAMEHPDCVDDYYDGGCAGCPSDYEYVNEPEWCRCSGFSRCTECWDREIPEEKVRGQRAKLPLIEDNEAPKEIIDEVIAPLDIPAIKDSGDRTEFESGAVRDMREGKGRCDLVPLEVAARVFCDPVLNPRDYDINLTDIRKFQETGSTNYLYYVLRRFSKEYGGYETMLLEVAEHYEEGAKKYGPDNWQKGMPVWCYIDSAVRHYLKWRRGDKDEPHNRAFVWNLMCCIWEVDYREKEQ